MLSRIIGSILFFFIVVLILPQCGDEEGLNSVGYQTAPRVAHGPVNADNPYDSVGIVHNERCEYVSAYINDSDSTIEQKWAKVCSGVRDYGAEVGWTEVYTEEVIESARTWMNSLTAGFDAIDSLSNCTSSSYITTREAGFISSIGGAFNSATDSAGLMNALLQIESDMVGESWDPEETVALSLISIAKHSFCLWYLTLDLGLQWGIYTACMDLEGHRKARDTGSSEAGASDTGFILSQMAAVGWTPGTQLPGC